MIDAARALFTARHFGEPRLPRFKIFAALSSKYSTGDKSSTNLHLRACLGARLFPAKMMSNALGTPISRGNLVEPPHAGRRPICVSGRPILVERSVEAIR